MSLAEDRASTIGRINYVFAKYANVVYFKRNLPAQAALVAELPDFTAAVALFGIDFSIRRISIAKMPDVAI